MQICNFAQDFKNIKMNKFKYFIIGGAIILYSLSIEARAYYLYCSNMVYNTQKGNNGSRVPRRPLRVDYTNNVLTVPELLVDYTLTITDKEGNEISCLLTSNVLTLPSSFVGELDIFFTDGNQTFYGIIDAE